MVFTVRKELPAVGGTNMGSGADATKANWQALMRLAGKLFANLRRENPEWHFGELKNHLGLPETTLFRELAEEAGVEHGSALCSTDKNRILRVMRRGIFGPAQIARDTKLPLAQVKDFLDEVGVPFGAGGYGMFPWPGGSDGAAAGRRPKAQPRRVTKNGQVSYRGRLYGLGRCYAGTIAWVEDRGEKLAFHFLGRRFPEKPTVTHYKTA